MRERAARSLQAILGQKTLKPIQVIVVDTQTSVPNIEGSDAPGLIYLKYPDAPSLTRAQLHAIPHCSSEFIAFVEDHAFVEPEWVEGVLKGFETGADVVVYTYCDATPESVYSRAFALMNYGKWMSGQFAGKQRDGPGNNIAYRKGVLLRQGDRLEDLMHIEWFMHRAIREQGGIIYQEATAKMAHANWNTLWGTLSDTHACSRLFAYQRVLLEKPSLSKRLFYVAAMPLLPVVKFWRSYQALKPDPEILRLFILRSPLILFFMICSSISEAMGYFDSRSPYRNHMNVELNLPRACDGKSRIRKHAG